MSLTTLGWLFTLGVLTHNTEEALHLPAWSVRAGRWHAPVGKTEFRFAVAALSALLLNLPLGALYLGRALSERTIELGVFVWSGPLTALAIVASIPILFWLGRTLGRAGA